MNVIYSDTLLTFFLDRNRQELGNFHNQVMRDAIKSFSQDHQDGPCNRIVVKLRFPLFYEFNQIMLCAVSCSRDEIEHDEMFVS